MPVKKTTSNRSKPKSPKAADPVREVIQKVRAAGVALENVFEAMSRTQSSIDEAAFLTASPRRRSVTIIEFSTSSPGKRQTIQLLVMGNEVFIEIPGSAKLAKKIKNLARRSERSGNLISKI